MEHAQARGQAQRGQRAAARRHTQRLRPSGRPPVRSFVRSQVHPGVIELRRSHSGFSVTHTSIERGATSRVAGPGTKLAGQADNSEAGNPPRLTTFASAPYQSSSGHGSAEPPEWKQLSVSVVAPSRKAASMGTKPSPVTPWPSPRMSRNAVKPFFAAPSPDSSPITRFDETHT